MEYCKNCILCFCLLVVLGVFADDSDEVLEKGENIVFSENDVKLILDIHNEVRALNITPPASNMRELSWEEALADFARNWTGNCEYKFKENTTTDLWKGVGQTFFLATGDWTVDFHHTAVRNWLEQRKDFFYENGTCVGGRFCGHYVQLVYSEGYKVGCAAASCPVVLLTNNDRRIPNCTFYMCAYISEASLQVGFKPYISGDGCTNCTDPQDSCTELKLCTNPKRTVPLQKSQAGNVLEDLAKQAWANREKIIIGVSAAAGVIGILGGISKKCKGGTVRPSNKSNGETGQ